MKIRVLSLMFLVLTGLSTSFWANSAALPSASSYAAVIDAGSSGSRIYLYQLRAKGVQIQVEDLFSHEPQDTPGLSDFKEKPKEAYAGGVAPLVVSLRAFMAERGIKESDITLHLLATGGLRLLEAAQSEAILGSVRLGLQETAFKVGRVGILPSELEGLFAWADLNALLGRLASGKETLGIVEIGGASAQIAYEVKGMSTPAQRTWKIQGRKYQIISRSFLGLGQNAARKAMIQSAGGGTRDNPCYPQGVSVKDKKTGVDGLTGAFDFARCTSLYRDVIRQNPDFDGALLKAATNRSFAGIGQGNPVGAIKGSISLWKLDGSYPHETLKLLQDACGHSWSAFQDQFGADLVNQNQCANTVFIETLLYDKRALHLGARQLKHMELAGGRVPSWTRGFLLVPEHDVH